REAIPFDMQHDAGSDQVGRRVDGAPDHALGVDRPADHAAWIYGLQVDAVELAAVALEVPPRNPVLGADDGGAVAKRLAKSFRDRGHTVGLEGQKDRVHAGHDREVVGTFRVDGEFAVSLDDPQAVLAHRLEVGSSGDQDHVHIGLRHPPAQKSADGSGSEDRESHRGLSCSATNRRWTLPVGVRGMDSTICTRLGTLNSASRPRQWAISSFSETVSERTTAAATSSPQVECGTPKLTASFTAGCDSSASSISRGAIFSPPRLMSS